MIYWFKPNKEQTQMTNTINLDKNNTPLYVNTLNQHGLILGASGSGKSNTVEYLAQELKDHGVPVILTDVKGDLTRMHHIGENNVVTAPLQNKGLGLSIDIQSMDLDTLEMVITNGSKLTPAQKTIIATAMGHNKRINTLTDLYNHIVCEHPDGKYPTAVKNVLDKIQYAVEVLNLDDMFSSGSKVDQKLFSEFDINIIDCTELVKNQFAYSAFMLNLLKVAYSLPEVGNLDKPKLAIFIDEAHLLFNSVNKDQLVNLISIVKLIRSKGVSLWFISQGINDIADGVVGMLSTVIQHRLTADFSDTGQKSIQKIDKALNRLTSHKVNYANQIVNLRLGEALIVRLDQNRSPMMPQKVQINISTANQLGLSPLSDKEFKELYPKKFIFSIPKIIFWLCLIGALINSFFF